MAKKPKGNKIDGWVNLNKPVGMTSTQALSIVKRALQPQKAGHAGTLDPLASGILPIALGEATKTVPYVQDSLKIYNFTVTWGEQRSTDDNEGHAIKTSDARPTLDQIKSLLPSFTGEISQIPPRFSAIKVDGARAYDVARDGGELDLKPRIVYIESIKVVPFPLTHPSPRGGEGNEGSGTLVPYPQSGEGGENTMNQTSFTALCGKGTYVRAIARDMGEKLGCFGYISALERASVGPFTLENSISLDIFQNIEHKVATEDVLLPLDTALGDIPVLMLREQEASRLKNGNVLTLLSKPDLDRMTMAGINWEGKDITTALTMYDKKPIAIVEVHGIELHPLRIFNV